MKRVVAYVDGYNLYYGLLKGTPYKWLDLTAFVRSFLRPDQQLTSVKYFTAPVKTHPHDLAAQDRQKIYLQALAQDPLVKIELGFYSKNKTLAPPVNAKCRECVASVSGLLPVVKLEEKRSDVNLAVAAVVDAALDRADCQFFFTGDSDQAGTVSVVRNIFGKRSCVFNPHKDYSVHLKTAASYYRNIPRDRAASCQLPETIPVGSHGRCLHRPMAWS